MIYTVKISKQFKKDFAKLDAITQSRVLLVLESMRGKPLENSKKLINVKVGIYRRRIGDFRLRYDIIKKEHVLILYRIRHRKEVYKED